MSVYIRKVVQGSFHQDHDRFGETAGRQCSCCALFSICFSTVSAHWNSSDLDLFVTEGDRLYKEKNTNLYLLATELPRLVTLSRTDCAVDLLENNFGFISFGQVNPFLAQAFRAGGEGFILFLKGICISILWTQRAYYLFDSHSKDNRGQSCSNGASVLIKFIRRTDLECHIVTTYLNPSEFNIQFETQNIATRRNAGIDFTI